MVSPIHPGLFLRTEIIEAHGLTVTEGAKILLVSRPTLSSLLNAKSDLSGDMALRFEKAFGVNMETLMRMQNSHDIIRTRLREKLIKVAPYEPEGSAVHKKQGVTVHRGGKSLSVQSVNRVIAASQEARNRSISSKRKPS